jgi:hypothetical protein
MKEYGENGWIGPAANGYDVHWTGQCGKETPDQVCKQSRLDTDLSHYTL